MTQSSISPATIDSMTQLSISSSDEPASTHSTPTSSAPTSVDISITSTNVPTPSITSFQPSATLSDAPASTVLPVDPPTSSCNACPEHHMDVHENNVKSKIASFAGMIPNNCSVNGFNYVYSENLDPSQVGYNMTITPIPFCSGLSTSTCENPLLGYNSTKNLWGAWRNCESYQHRESFNC